MFAFLTFCTFLVFVINIFVSLLVVFVTRHAIIGKTSFHDGRIATEVGCWKNRGSRGAGGGGGFWSRKMCHEG
jgi:hypothetical protein